MPMGSDSFCNTDHRKKAAKLLPKKCEGIALSCQGVTKCSANEGSDGADDLKFRRENTFWTVK